MVFKTQIGPFPYGDKRDVDSMDFCYLEKAAVTSESVFRRLHSAPGLRGCHSATVVPGNAANEH